MTQGGANAPPRPPLNTALPLSPEVEIRFLIWQDKMSRQFELWLDISRIWLDKFSGPIMIIIIMIATEVLTFNTSNLERMTMFLILSQLTSETLSLTLARS